MQRYRLIKKEECNIDNKFWQHYISLVKEEVIPYQWEILNDNIPDSEPSHSIDNYKIAAGLMEGNFYGEVFQDSDVAKWLEAVGNILLIYKDEELEKKADSIIDIIELAQEKDGYLNTYFSIEEPDKKWTNLLECHELYCAGHFIEAAVAYYMATGKGKIIEIAKKLADHICHIFGYGKQIEGYPGHQEIEIALIRLYDVTGIDKYFETAQFFIDARGTSDFFEEEFEKRDRICFWSKAKERDPNRWYNQFPYDYYNQFHLPVREQTSPVGHSVRAVYMYTAMADIASRTNDKELINACENIWNNIVDRQMYITGGIGSTHSGEAFTLDYDLPNDTNYSETCASIGLMFFAQKMMKLDAHRSYGDVIERALYNTVLAGMNYEGNRFFYVNPLEVVPDTCKANTERNHVKPVRQKWFACACCPPNLARTIPRLWEYIYTVSKDTVYTHLFMGSDSVIELDNGNLEIKQITNYPEDTTINFEVKSTTDKELNLALRIPEWSRTYKVIIDGKEEDTQVMDNGFIYINKNFEELTKITLELDDKAYLMQSNDKVHFNMGRVAISRGPLVYCLEEVDNGSGLNQICIDGSSELIVKKEETWNGSTAIYTKGYRQKSFSPEQGLYQPYSKNEEEVEIKAIPYHLWNNREPGEMQVWVRVK